MNPTDDELRATVAQLDPRPGPPPAAVLDRILADDAPVSRTWWHRHWQGTLLAAAGVATLALASAVIVPQFGPSYGGADSAVASSVRPEAAVDSVAPGAPEPLAADAPTIARSATVLVGTDDQGAGRDAFVGTVTGLGGRVLSESVSTRGGGGVTPAGADIAIAPGWYPGPGTYLTVEVPVDGYEQALEAARRTGEVVQLEQSSYDVGTQVADVGARIAALEASLARLTGLLGQAASVSDVVSVETAISERQAELDGLKAQQRELTSQTSMSRISLTLMSPDDARDAVDPQPQRTWWQAFLDGLADLWAWLGKALLIVSPLLLAGAVIWWVRRRRSR